MVNSGEVNGIPCARPTITLSCTDILRDELGF